MNNIIRIGLAAAAVVVIAPVGPTAVPPDGRHGGSRP
jgi:hypothetical protein